MRLFRFVSTFTIEKDEVRASLNISQIQIFRILEMRVKYLRLLFETSRLLLPPNYDGANILDAVQPHLT